MNTINEIIKNTKGSTYERAFWNAMRLKTVDTDALREGKVPGASAFILPSNEADKLKEGIAEKSVIRPLTTVHTHYEGGADILSASTDEYGAFVPEGNLIPDFDMMDDFKKIRTYLYKATSLVKVPSEFIYDASFDMQDYLMKRFSKTFANAEDEAFINGTGINEPTGLLHPSDGAEVAATVEALTYDAVIDLFFSVPKECRKNAVWMMNDATALALRKMKDADGNYLWNQATDTILGKPVIICNEMPDAETGKKPVLFGDLSYYWIIDCSPVCIKALEELFAMNDQVGYIGYEFLDAKLIRSDAVKVISIG